MNCNFPSKINWKINYGEQWAIIGANGAGKPCSLMYYLDIRVSRK